MRRGLQRLTMIPSKCLDNNITNHELSTTLKPYAREKSRSIIYAVKIQEKNRYL